MSLSLTIVSSPVGLNLLEATRKFSDPEVSIGRGAANMWILDDPDRFLSSNHCRLIESGSQYILKDLSTNGTFHNGSPEAIGKNNEIALATGDTFELGDYSFQVTIEVSAASPDLALGASPFDSPVQDVPLNSEFDAFPLGSSDPFSSEGLDLGGIPLSPDQEVSDPLVALDGAGMQSSEGDDPFFGVKTPSDSPFSDPLSIQSPSSGAAGSYGDGSEALGQHIEWPSSSEQNVIPEGWDDDLGFLNDDADPMADPFAAPNLTPKSGADTLNRSSGAVPKPKPRARDAGQSSTGNQSQRLVAARNAAALKAKQAEAASGGVKRKPGSSASGGANRSFIDAMGLDSSQLSDAQVEEISVLAGELMREVTGGMMQLLRSRTTIKNEFRMNVTTIQPVENNSLKFSVSVDEALENLFIKKNGAYKEPIESFREGFQGVGEHQVAIIAGIRFAFESMIDRFDPFKLESMFNRGKKGGVIPAMQKAKNWSSYSEYYENLVGDMERTFQQLFGDNFVQAYEDQLRKLIADRKKEK